MYISTEIADRIKDAARHNNVTVKRMLSEVGLGSNTMSNLKTSMIKADSLAIIADYLNVSVDYLLGRSDAPTMTLPPEDIDTSTTDGAALLAIYNRLSPVDRAKLLLYADGLTRNSGNDGNGSKDGKDGDI